MSDRVGCPLGLLGGHVVHPAKNALQAVLHSLSLGELALHTGAASDVVRASRRPLGLCVGAGMHGDWGGRADEARASRHPLALLGPQVVFQASAKVGVAREKASHHPLEPPECNNVGQWGSECILHGVGSCWPRRLAVISPSGAGLRSFSSS
jgi:hypothetical protein